MQNLKTIQVPISIETFKEQIRKLDVKTIIELYNIIEEILLQHEDEQLASNLQLRDAIEVAREEYRCGKFKPLREIYREKKEC